MKSTICYLRKTIIPIYQIIQPFSQGYMLTKIWKYQFIQIFEVRAYIFPQINLVPQRPMEHLLRLLLMMQHSNLLEIKVIEPFLTE